MSLGSRLSYANVVATLALVLAIGGGTVYAASELGRNDVKSRNIAKGETTRTVRSACWPREHRSTSRPR